MRDTVAPTYFVACGFRGAEEMIPAAGRLMRRGQPTAWHVGQLTETGRRAKYPSVRRLL